MHYDPALNNHGLPHNPFKAIVAPRPIGWISTISDQGHVNLAPYSYFNAFCDTPPIVGFASSGYKDSLKNVEATGEFVCNMVSLAFFESMSLTSASMPYGVNEMEVAGLKPIKSLKVKPPRVDGVPAALECKVLSIQQLQDIEGRAVKSWMILGQVISIFIDDAALRNGLLDTEVIKPLSRLGYQDYAAVERVLTLKRP